MRQDVALDRIKPETDAQTGIRHGAALFYLGAKIRKPRRRHSLTLQDVSDLSGLSKPLLPQIKNETDAPPIPTLIRIAMVLRVKIGCFSRGKSHNQQVSALRKDSRRVAMKLPRNRPESSQAMVLFRRFSRCLINTWSRFGYAMNPAIKPKGPAISIVVGNVEKVVFCSGCRG